MSNEGDKLPPWHPLVVPGEAWSDYWRRERRRQRERLPDPLSRQCPDPRHVDPPKYPD